MFCRRVPGKRLLSCKNILLVTMLTLAVAGLSAQGCGEESADSETTSSTTTSAPATVVLTEEWLGSRADSKIGGSNLVREVTITESGADRSIEVHVDRPEVCHDGAVVGTLAVFTQNMLGIIYNKFPEVSDVEIVMYGIEQGVVSDDIAMSVTVNRDTAQGIDWFDFDASNMLELVDEYYMHPIIEESFRLEGALPYDEQT